MKRILLLIIIMSLAIMNLYAHMQWVHQRITHEAFDLLKLSYPSSYHGLDEMESYLGTDETYDQHWNDSPNSSYAGPKLGDSKITSGSWVEDEFDIVYHYGYPKMPDYGPIDQIAYDLLDLTNLVNNNKTHRTITHFWDADNGGEIASTHLTDTISGDIGQATWDFTIPENAMKKIRAYQTGNYVERHMYPDGTSVYIDGSGYQQVWYTDHALPGIIGLYNANGQMGHIVGYENLTNIVSCNVPYYILGKPYAYNRLGRMCHLLEDMSIPAHAHCTSHAGQQGMYKDEYEVDEGDKYFSWAANEVFNQFGSYIDVMNEPDPLYDLMYIMNQVGDHYADGKRNGDDNYDHSIPYLDAIYQTLGNQTHTSDINYNSTYDNFINNPNFNEMYNTIVPQTIRATAGLLYWFGIETGQLSPPPPAMMVSGCVHYANQQNHANIKVELNYAGGQAYATTNSSGCYTFYIPPRFWGQRITITCSDPHYYDNYQEITTDPTGQNMDIPLTVINPVNFNQMYVSDSHNPNAFVSIDQAMEFINLMISDHMVSNNEVYLNILPGDIDLSDCTLHNTNTIPLNITLRGLSGATVRRVDNDGKNEISIENCKLTFQNVHFISNSPLYVPEQNGLQNTNAMKLSNDATSSFTFINCIFDYPPETGNISNRVIASNSFSIAFINCTMSNFGICREGFGDGSMHFDNCNHISFDLCTFHDCGSNLGGAIFAADVNDLRITNCHFNNNIAVSLSLTAHGKGGALYLENCTRPLIKNNTFLENEVSSGGSAIHCERNLLNPINFVISNNLFQNNKIFDDVNITTDMNQVADAILFDDVLLGSESKFYNNIIIDNNETHNACIIRYIHSQGYLNINNTDFIASTNGSLVLASDESTIPTIFDNCIFSSGNGSSQFVCQTLPVIKYSYYTSSLNINGAIPINLDHVSQVNYSDLKLDEHYIPIWNDTYRSPCIDAGAPDTDPGISFLNVPWDVDSDNSRYDIGACIQQNPGHANGIITLKKSEEWNWISIPAVDAFANSTRYADHIFNVFNNFQNNGLFEDRDQYRLLEEMDWLYNDHSGKVNWDSQHGAFATLEPEHQVRCQYGYKVQLRRDEGSFVCPDKKVIEYDGFKPGSVPGNIISTLEIMPPVVGELGCNINPETGVLERETWLGYWLDKSMSPFVALAPVLPFIVSIKAQDWCMERELTGNPNHPYSENWLGVIENGEDLAINQGEMVAVKYIGTSDAQFHWGGEDLEPPSSPYFKREKPEHFVYNPKEDYLPIFAYIDLSGYEEGKEPAEIAFYVDGVCKGAEKIKGEEVQLKAYVMDDPFFEDKTIEFKLWSPIKSVSETNASYQVMNNQTGNYNSQPISLNNCGDYIRVRLYDSGTTVPYLPTITSLIGNYPNPFNPETTIKYALANQSDVHLDVFNIKGQKVKTLVNDKKSAGYYSVKWDGKDDNGHQVSSGVYFTRFIGDKKNLTRKMILLK
ncbi:MAG TPA: FlgD immunoglobulin-like domain containing protein [Candidatus Cloacimonadota bacterium]|nr:FlgD immunoglobulin-like domain containing protein [Candidatus Cloacimonadota bacterium]